MESLNGRAYRHMRRMMEEPTGEGPEIFKLADKAFRETRWCGRNGRSRTDGWGAGRIPACSISGTRGFKCYMSDGVLCSHLRGA